MNDEIIYTQREQTHNELIHAVTFLDARSAESRFVYFMRFLWTASKQSKVFL